MKGYPHGLSTEEMEAYALYRAARLSYTQAWTLAGESYSDWWMNRILIYDRVEQSILNESGD